MDFNKKENVFNHLFLFCYLVFYHCSHRTLASYGSVSGISRITWNILGCFPGHEDVWVIQWRISKQSKILSRMPINQVQLIIIIISFSGPSRPKFYYNSNDHPQTTNKYDPNCKLICDLHLLETTSDDWGCILQDIHIFPECSTLTASMLNNAITTDTKYPFLRNFTSPTFGIAFDTLYPNGNDRPKLND